MGTEYDEQNVSRRHFLRGAAVTALAATAAGAGAALVNKSTSPRTIEVVPQQAMLPTQTVVSTLTDPMTDALTQLAALQAENTRLQTALTTARQQIETLQQSQSDTINQSEAITVELDQANHQIGLYAGLIALYEQIDNIDLNTILDNGMTAVSTAITSLTDDLPSLAESLQIGENALNEFEAHIPLLQNGRSWLNDQTGKLQLYFTAIEKLLEKGVDQIGPFFDMLHNWFQEVQKWLPFGIGQRAAEIMASITTLLMETPQTIAGLRTNLSEPLEVWLGSDDTETPLQQQLVNPIRHSVLSKANTVSSKSQQIETVYRTRLADPTKTAVDRHQAIRHLITQYREQYQI